MEFFTLLASIRRNSLGAVLVVLQVALTLTIVLNVAGIVRDHIARMNSASGVDEPNVFSFVNIWAGHPTDSPARVARDLVILRATPGVVDAVSTNGIPLSGAGWGSAIDTKPVDPANSINLTHAQLYILDEHGAGALGLHLTAGRWFTREEVDMAGKPEAQGVAIITQALARALFPGGQALGKSVYAQGDTALTVIGVLQTLQVDHPGDPKRGPDAVQFSLVLPARLAMPTFNHYIVRTKPGALTSVMPEVERRLRAEQPLRVISEFRPFSETRVDIYRANRTLTVILVTVSVMLFVVAGLGMVGLTSYWVAQRRRLIGIRRALGATRADILRYFQSENLLIVGVGVALGTLLAVLLNLWLATHFNLPRVERSYLVGGALGVLLLGQFAALWPALRAASIPPALATRSA